MENKYLNALLNFIKENDNYEELLKKPPYNLKAIKTCSFNKNWKMFVYNLFDSELTNPVVRGCRGTVIDTLKMEVVSAPYTKFFNYGSSAGKDIESSINWANAQIFSKIDGILIKTACVMDSNPNDGRPEKRLYFFTNGSFELNAPFEDSMVYDEPETRGAETYGDLLEYAIKKADSHKFKFIKIHYNKEVGCFYVTGGWVNFIPCGSTFMLELTSPRNKIICKYKETKLWWHGYRDENGVEHDPREVKFELDPDFDIDGTGFTLPFEIPKLYNAHNYDELKELLKTFKGSEQEGVVVVDYSSKETPRVKIKCDDYLKLKFAHDTSCNVHVLFKAVVDDEYDDLMGSIPTTQSKIEEIKKTISIIQSWFVAKSLEYARLKFSGRKEYVEWVKKNTNPALFSIYMDIPDPMALMKFKKRLQFLSVEKHGYEKLLKILEEIKK